MSEVKYNIDLETPMTVNEPAVSYGYSVEEVDRLLPDDIILEAVRYCAQARSEGRMIPNDKVQGLLAERFGW